jgi:hypothetical protein
VDHEVDELGDFLGVLVPAEALSISEARYWPVCLPSFVGIGASP